METTALPDPFGVRLPAWVAAELADVPVLLPSDDDRIRLANRLAERNHREEAVEVFRAYGARDDAVVCNARGAV